jgi:hypothetical protein
MGRRTVAGALVLWGGLLGAHPVPGGDIGTVHAGWRHLSSRTGDLEAPSDGRQQTASAVFDADGDGINDFVITERTEAPSVLLYLRRADGWRRSVLEPEALPIEAGAAPFDVDRDGDVDLVLGGDWRSNQVWWWENPRPEGRVDGPWTRRLVKSSGRNKQHDQIAGDVDGDGELELVFWNQEDAALLLAEVPDDPRGTQPWPIVEIYRYSTDSQPEQRGTFPGWKGVNEHEGLDLGDVDGDGRPDIVGGGLWFKHLGGFVYNPNPIDPGYAFSRSAVGQLKKGGRPEVVLSVGDGEGPLLWYEWVEGTWVSHEVARLLNGHSLDLVDFDGDGNLDIFTAEMDLDGSNPGAGAWIFLGDGGGGFTPTVISEGVGHHESRIADLDGDGDLDVLAKPYNGDTPRIDVFLNEGPSRR